MPLHYVTGDPLLTTMQTLAVGINAAARAEVTPFAMALEHRYPTAFSAYRKQVRAGRIKMGDMWIWRDSTPRLAFLVVRRTAASTTRPRDIDRVALRIARDYLLEGITSLAIAPLGREEEWAAIQEALDLMLPRSPLPVVVYRDYQPGKSTVENGAG